MLRSSGWFAARPEPDLRAVLDLVALGTIADLAPLQGVNRTLTRIGLTLLASGTRPGVQALKEVAGVKVVNCGVVGFQLAPRLNAAGRLEDAARGVELLLEPDRARALETARLLDRFNRERQLIEQQTLEEAVAMVAELPAEHTHAIVLARDDWHSGVIGIVASRLIDRFYRPTVLIALDGEGGKGSGRSIRGLHLYRTLQECSAHLLAFGGHEMAAGVSLAREQVAAFARQFEASARAALIADDLIPVLLYDGVTLLEELSLDQVMALERLAPFGMGNPEPVLLVEKVRARQLQRVGDGHLRFLACQGGDSVQAIAFGMVARLDEFQGELDLLVSPQINRYNGREAVQVRVRDVRDTAKAELL
jgi:single-stranded-DNA-specific exonuclease